MFHLSYASPYEGEIKTLRFPSPDGKKNNPVWCGLGWYTDINGVRWDVRGIIGGAYSSSGRTYIQARPIDNLPIYRTDSESVGQGYSATWIPYYVEIIQEEEHVEVP